MFRLSLFALFFSVFVLFCGPDSSGVKYYALQASVWEVECSDAHVELGDTVCFSSSGNWDMGLGFVGPEGKNDLCECPVSTQMSDGHFQGPIGAVIGKIGQGNYFFIGSKKEFVACDSGSLYLGANDNMGFCKNYRGSCYADNRGTMIITIKIKPKQISL